LNAFGGGAFRKERRGWFVIFYDTPHASVMERNGSDIFNFLNGLCDGILGTAGGVKDLMLLGVPRWNYDRNLDQSWMVAV
jgi:hypothetical protein